VWVNLKGIVIVGRVFEQAVEGVEHFVRKQEEELSVMLLVVWSYFSQPTRGIIYRERPP
jgi:hypothetical protein